MSNVFVFNSTLFVEQKHVQNRMLIRENDVKRGFKVIFIKLQNDKFERTDDIVGYLLQKYQ